MCFFFTIAIKSIPESCKENSLCWCHPARAVVVIPAANEAAAAFEMCWQASEDKMRIRTISQMIHLTSILFFGLLFDSISVDILIASYVSP